MSDCVSRLRVFSFWRLIMCPICCATIFSLIPNQPQTLSFGQAKKKKKSKKKNNKNKKEKIPYDSTTMIYYNNDDDDV